MKNISIIIITIIIMLATTVRTLLCTDNGMYSILPYSQHVITIRCQVKSTLDLLLMSLINNNHAAVKQQANHVTYRSTILSFCAFK